MKWPATKRMRVIGMRYMRDGIQRYVLRCMVHNDIGGIPIVGMLYLALCASHTAHEIMQQPMLRTYERSKDEKCLSVAFKTRTGYAIYGGGIVDIYEEYEGDTADDEVARNKADAGEWPDNDEPREVVEVDSQM